MTVSYNHVSREVSHLRIEQDKWRHSLVYDFVPPIKCIQVSCDRSLTNSVPPKFKHGPVFYLYLSARFFLFSLLLKNICIGVCRDEVRIFDHLEVKSVIVVANINALPFLIIDAVFEDEVDEDFDATVDAQQQANLRPLVHSFIIGGS